MAETYKKIIVNGVGAEPQIVDFTPEEVAQKEADIENAKVKSEAFYAKERRHVEKAIILYQVDGRWNGEYLEDEKDEFLKTHSLPIGPG